MPALKHTTLWNAVNAKNKMPGAFHLLEKDEELHPDPSIITVLSDVVPIAILAHPSSEW